MTQIHAETGPEAGFVFLTVEVVHEGPSHQQNTNRTSSKILT